jgi:hypothetical protein
MVLEPSRLRLWTSASPLNRHKGLGVTLDLFAKMMGLFIGCQQVVEDLRIHFNRQYRITNRARLEALCKAA